MISDLSFWSFEGAFANLERSRERERERAHGSLRIHSNRKALFYNITVIDSEDLSFSALIIPFPTKPYTNLYIVIL
jgi:hypothetical protein